MSHHDCWCQMSWETGVCCYTADLNETQGDMCDNCAENHSGELE